MINAAHMSVTRFKLLLVMSLLAVQSGCTPRVPRAELEEGCRDRLPKRCGQLADELLAQRDGQAALPFYERACDLGHSGNCLRLAEVLEWGWGVEPNRDRARALYDTSCRTGVLGACHARKLFDELESAVLCRPEETPELVERIRQARELQYESLGYCYQALDSEVPLINVKVVALIGRDGRVHDAELAEDSRPDLNAGQCMREQILKWRFPCPPSEGRIPINLEFNPKVKNSR